MGRAARAIALALSVAVMVGVIPEALAPTAVLAAPAASSPPSPASEIPVPGPGGVPAPVPPSSAPPVVDKVLTGFQEGKSKLDDTKTTPTRREFDNPDGTRTMELNATPVRFKDQAGDWTDIDLTLESQPGGKLGAKAARNSAKLAKKASGDIVVLEGDQGALALRHPDATGADAVVEGRTARFKGGLSGGRDLVEALTTNGVEETVVLNAAGASPTYIVELMLPGKLEARQAAGGVELVDEGNVVGGFAGGLAFDSARRPSETPVSVRLVESKNKKATVEVSIDAAWLARAVLPVTIDPYATYAPSSYVYDGCATSAYPGLVWDPYRSCDTYVNSDAWDNAYSSQTQLRTGSPGFADQYDGGTNRTRTYIQWPTDSIGTNCPTCSPPSDFRFTVISAKVEMYTYDGSPTYGITNLSGAARWPTTATTWRNQPDPTRTGYPPSVGSSFYGGQGLVSWNVQTLAQQWFNGSALNYGLVLEADDERNPNLFRKYYSGETGYGYPYVPKLSVTYNRKPPVSAPLSPVGGVTTASTQPTLSTTPVTDPDGNTVNYYLRIVDPATGGVIDSGWSTSTTWTVPAGRLSPGRAYQWEVYTWDGVDVVGPSARASFVTPIVLKANSDELGLEQFYPYDRIDLGSASGNVNLRTGNLVVSQDDAFVPRQGLNVAVRRVYNSADTTDPDGLGVGWRLSTTDLDAGLEAVAGAVSDLNLSAGLSITDLVDSATGKVLSFTDGDGTTHRFVRPGGPGTRWESPPGVSLRVREAAAADGFGAGYELIRPDGVIYRANLVIDVPPTWRVTSVTDRNGNRLFYDYELRPGLPLPQGRLVAIRHNRDAAQVVVRFDYDLLGKLVAIVALPGSSAVDPATVAVRSWERTTRLGYANGRLSTVTRNEQATPAGGKATTGFAYNADARLSGVTDGRNATTALSYTGTGTAAQLTGVTDRRAKAWSWSYGAADANGGRTTTATRPVGASDPDGAKIAYTISGRTALADGRLAGANIVAIADDGTDAGAVTSAYRWVENRLVETTDGVGNKTVTEYNDLGLVTKTTAPAANAASRADLTDPAYPKVAIVSTVSYRYPAGFSYAGCTEPAPTGEVTKAAYCQMVADTERSVAADNVAAQRRVTDFDPDPAGNVRSVTRRALPSGAASTGDRIEGFVYYARGGLCSADGPRADVADVTRFGDAASTGLACASAADPNYGGYDITGKPRRVLDALAKASDAAYTPYGQLARGIDRDGRVTTARYDDANNLIETTDPAASVTTTTYDANDNPLIVTSPRGTATATVGDFETRSVYDANDWPISVSTPGATEAAPRVVATTAYNDDGTKASATNPVGGVTDFTYHPNRLVSQSAAPATTSGPKALTDYRYDTGGRVIRSISPAVDAAGSVRPEELIDYTPGGQVSIRRETSAIAGVMRTTRYAYNAQAEQSQTAGPRTVSGEEEKSEQTHDAFGQVTLSRRRLPGRWLDTPASYDAAGNAVATSTLTGTNQVLTSSFRFDALGRVIAQSFDPTNVEHEVAFTYEGEGAQLSRLDLRQSSGPPSAACGDTGVTCTTLRTTTSTYNGDGTPASTVATDDAAKRLVTCNYATGVSPASGYDADKNPRATRTLTTGTCADDTAATAGSTRTMAYDSRGLLATMTQAVRSPESSQMVSRSQSFVHRADATIATATHAGQATSYTRSPAGWVQSLTDWRSINSTMAYSPSGTLTASTLGPIARSTRTYKPDGALASLVWGGAPGTNLRSHTALAYDVGGLRTSEEVTRPYPTGTLGTDPGGPAAYSYDLLGRLSAYTSPFKAPGESAEPSVTYSLDDGANIVSQTTSVAGATRIAETSTYPAGRLATRRSVIGSTTADLAFGYSPLGEETSRSTTASPAVATITTTYDAAGHVGSAEGVSYLYDGADHLLARTKGTDTTLYFYWGPGALLAEEADGAGATVARYLADGGGGLVGQQSWRRVAGHKDPNDLVGTWAWLLDDTAGNVATQVNDAGAVLEQAAFDPYGAVEAGGSAQGPTAPGSSLGFQATLTDRSTKRVILGPRQYDPSTARFTNPDVFVGAAADIALGLDPLTGNRYLFAGANPVAYYEDGHGAKAKPRVLPPALYGPCVRAASGGGSQALFSSPICRRYREALVSGRTELFFGYSSSNGFFVRNLSVFKTTLTVISYATAFASIAVAPFVAGATLPIALTITSAASGVTAAVASTDCRAGRISTSVATNSLGAAGSTALRFAERPFGAAAVEGAALLAGRFYPCRR